MAAVLCCPEDIRVCLLKPMPRELHVILKSIKVKDIHIGHQPIGDIGRGVTHLASSRSRA
jgi:hypothetical protein